MSIETNSLYCSDCIELMKQFPEDCVDLIYADPPFYDRKLFDENRKLKEYLQWTKEWLEESKRIMKEIGSIYVHCDQLFSHYMRFAMDRVFGYENFQNEVIWRYAWGVHKTKRWNRKHDTILFYSKSNKWKFNPYEVMDKREGTILQRMELEKDYDWVAKKSKYSDKTMKLPSDVWYIPTINALAKERVNRILYPTQKPEALLERIIRASSNEGDLVFDPFIGSGTTMVVVKRLGRNYIGCDRNPEAIAIAQKRLDSISV